MTAPQQTRLHVVLVAPQIPPNTGNVIRLCANTGAQLHLVAPLGFTLDDAKLRRAGLDYHEHASVRVHDDWPAFLASVAPQRLFAFSSHARTRMDSVRHAAGDALVFGNETDGLPYGVLESVPPAQRLYLPMQAGNRSLNLSNAVAVAVFMAWQQSGFAGAVIPGD